MHRLKIVMIADFSTSFSSHKTHVILFFHHFRDTSGDEEDGYDETLIPVDFQSAGQITDDELFTNLVKPMAKGVLMTSLMDCCHSGTVLDLPYRFTADGDVMERVPGFDFDNLLGVAVVACCCMDILGCLMQMLVD